MKVKRNYIMLLIIILLGFTFVACSNGKNDSESNQTIVFADAGWDSINIHNSIASIIIENGYGYKTDVLNGSTSATFAGFRKGDINAYMEVWTDNLIDVYQEAIDSGDIIEVSINFDDNAQGLYVPTFLIHGDSDRGLEPLAPNLKNINDLKDHWELFKDAEDPSKGRIYGSPPGWNVDKIMQEKVITYGLDENFNYFSPGSDTALSASLASAVERGEPWVGYYWEPTWVLGKYDMTLLEEDPYDEEKWNNGYGSSFPPMPVTVCVHKDLVDSAPEVVEFLGNYKTSSEITNKALAYMQDNESSTEEAAKWFLNEYEELWTSWVSEDIAQKVIDAIK